MSEIRVTTVSDTAGTGPVTLTKQKAPKALASTNNTGTTINESFNVSSLTDHATGQQRLNLTSSMSSTNWTGSLALRSVSDNIAFLDSISASRADGYSYTGSAYSDNYMLWQVNGDLA